MGRIARVVAVGLPHHVTQRGNNRAEVFFSDADRRYYLKTLAHYCDEFKLRVWAYCLMSNHVHILAVPEQEYSLAQGIGRTNLVYTQYVNRKYRRSGRLWQNRFSSCPVDAGEYLWTVCCYIETNPVRVGQARQAWDYRWSSARHHVKSVSDPLVRESPWLDPALRQEYRRHLEQGSQRPEIGQIRKAVQVGRPFGTAGFVDRLERELSRALRPGKRGPKPKTGKTS